MNFETINKDNFDEMVRRIVATLREAKSPLSFAEVSERTGIPEHIAAYCLGCLSLSVEIEFGEVPRFSWSPLSKAKRKGK